MSDPEERKFLRPEDIAARLDVATATVNAWMVSGELPFNEIAGERFVLMPAFERFVEHRDTGVTIEEQAERYIGPGFDGGIDPQTELYRAYVQDPERQAVARADHLELLRSEEQPRWSRPALRSRYSMTAEHLQRMMRGDPDTSPEFTEKEREEYRLIRLAHQDDTDMDLSPQYAPLLRDVQDRLGAMYPRLYHPEQFLPGEVTYPLDAAEVRLVLIALGIPAADATAPPYVSDVGYFARDVVRAAYEALFPRQPPR